MQYVHKLSVKPAPLLQNIHTHLSIRLEAPLQVIHLSIHLEAPLQLIHLSIRLEAPHQVIHLSIHPGSPISSKPSFQPNGASLSSQHWGTFWPQSDVYLQPSGIAWSYANDGNKLVHALQGNKRNPGYKYLAWNCGRGFVSERKIDDLKVTLNRHQPHLAGISEVDLYRNENNSDLSANNNFSTEQLHEKLHIKGYNIIVKTQIQQTTQLN